MGEMTLFWDRSKFRCTDVSHAAPQGSWSALPARAERGTEAEGRMLLWEVCVT